MPALIHPCLPNGTDRPAGAPDSASKTLPRSPVFCAAVNRPRHSGRQPAARRGSILLAVLVLVAVMTIGGLSYFEWTNVERRASTAFLRQTQALAAAESGAEYLRVYLANEPASIEQQGGLFENPNQFRGLLLSDSTAAALRSRVSLLAPHLDSLGNPSGYRFGLENESARINLNTILLADEYVENGAREMLTALPGVTDSIADAILDWIDEDDEPRPFGAELSYYSTLTPSYAPPNRPLESIDQLLLVRDVTESLLYGLDRDRNFVIDSQEAIGLLPEEVDNTDGSANRGLAGYLTLFSAERNLNSNGDPRIDVNQEDLETLHTEIERVLGREAANFIVAFRQGGPEPEGNRPGEAAGPAANTESAANLQIDFETPGSEPISSLLSLVGVNTSTTAANSDQRVVVETPFPNRPGELSTFLPDLFDNLTVNSDEVIPGRVNINQAPRAVLEGLPGMPPEVIDLIVSTRDFEPDSTRPGRQQGTWLLTEGIVDLEGMQELEPFVTGGGNVYRTQAIGFFDAEGGAARVQVVIDATGETPVLRRRKELTPLGVGLSAEQLGGVAALSLAP